MKLVVFFTSMVVLGGVTPAASGAQIVIGGGGQTAPKNASGVAKADPTEPTVRPGFLAYDDTTPPGPISADSFARAKAFAKSHHPVVIINHDVKTAADLDRIDVKSIATYRLKEPDDNGGDVNYYGKVASNGIMIVTLVPPPPPPPKKRRR